MDCTGQRAKILRPGGVTLEMLEDVLGKGNVDVHQAVLHPLESNAQAASPGMKYKHYAPKAQVRVIKAAHAAARICELYDEAVKTESTCRDLFRGRKKGPLSGIGISTPGGAGGAAGQRGADIFSRHCARPDRMGMDLVLCRRR